MPKGNAAEFAPEITVGDELIATNGLTFTTEQVYNDNIVRGGATLAESRFDGPAAAAVAAVAATLCPTSEQMCCCACLLLQARRMCG